MSFLPPYPHFSKFAGGACSRTHVHQEYYDVAADKIKGKFKDGYVREVE